MIPVIHKNLSPFLLDNIPEKPSSAYALFRLSSKYTGQLVRLRDTTTNNEFDFGYTSSGQLDQLSVANKIGANSATVSTWYDQGAQKFNANQTVLVRQPLLYSTGAITTRNGMPSMRFTGAPSVMPVYKQQASGVDWTDFTVVSVDDYTGNNNNVWDTDGLGGLNGIYRQNYISVFINQGVGATGVSPGGAPIVGNHFLSTTTNSAANVVQVAQNSQYGSPATVAWTTGTDTVNSLGTYFLAPSISLIGNIAFSMSFANLSVASRRQIELYLMKMYKLS